MTISRSSTPATLADCHSGDYVRVDQWLRISGKDTDKFRGGRLCTRNDDGTFTEHQGVNDWRPYPNTTKVRDYVPHRGQRDEGPTREGER